MQRLVQTNDVDGFVAIFQPSMYQCLPPLGELEEICMGAGRDDFRAAYALSEGGDGFAATKTQLREQVARLFESANKALENQNDVYGSGKAKVGSIVCRLTSPPFSRPCDLGQENIDVNITFISSGDVGFLGHRATFFIRAKWIDAALEPYVIGTFPFPSPNVALSAGYSWTP